MCECVHEWVNVNILKRFEWPLVRKALDKCSPFHPLKAIGSDANIDIHVQSAWQQFQLWALTLSVSRPPADINECEDISDSVALCQNGRCSNTEGSYKCSCLAGFVASAKPHECIPEIPQEVASEAG